MAWLVLAFRNVVRTSLWTMAQSWITGYNSNVEGHEYGNTRYNIFAAGVVEYTKHLDTEASSQFQGIDFS